MRASRPVGTGGVFALAGASTGRAGWGRREKDASGAPVKYLRLGTRTQYTGLIARAQQEVHDKARPLHHARASLRREQVVQEAGKRHTTEVPRVVTLPHA